MFKFKNDFVMPEIGINVAYGISIIAFFAGVIMGTQLTVLTQGLLIIAVVIFNKSWAVRGLELGAIAYIIISVVFVAGIIIGDVSYLFQTGFNIGTFNILSLFKVN
jgi:hypothetical protein